MDQKRALVAFGAISQETRLAIVRLLVATGPEGLSSGVLAERMGVSPSNISFHLKELERADLITQRRDARSIIYSARFGALSALVRFLMEDCCQGRPEVCLPLHDLTLCCPPTPEEELVP